MKLCPACRNTYPEDYQSCPRDGTPLTDASPRIAPGTILRGKYEVLEEIGAGGMATVYKVRHRAFQEIAAVKVVHAHFMHDPEFLKRFRNEAVVARRLKHPNAVRIDDFDTTEDGRPFIVMEFVDGRSLFQSRRDAPGPWPVERCLSVISQAAEALGAAHALGIVHRDIKPANILLVRGEPGLAHVKVLDFGIAKVTSNTVFAGMTSVMTRQGILVGTPAYMSPEQAEGRAETAIDGRSDLYSLGLVLYEMLTGAHPFEADTPGAMLNHQLYTLPMPPKALTEAVPPRISALVLRSLEKEPRDRFQTAAQMLEALHAVQGEEAAPSTPAPHVSRPRQPVVGGYNAPLRNDPSLLGPALPTKQPRERPLSAPGPPLTPNPETGDEAIGGVAPVSQPSDGPPQAEPENVAPEPEWAPPASPYRPAPPLSHADEPLPAPPVSAPDPDEKFGAGAVTAGPRGGPTRRRLAAGAGAAAVLLVGGWAARVYLAPSAAPVASVQPADVPRQRVAAASPHPEPGARPPSEAPAPRTKPAPPPESRAVGKREAASKAPPTAARSIPPPSARVTAMAKQPVSPPPSPKAGIAAAGATVVAAAPAAASAAPVAVSSGDLAGINLKAVQLYRAGRYAEAFPLAKQSCEAGNAIGCVDLGVMYDDGNGVSQDRAKAVSLYRKGCDGGNASGCTDLGNSYQAGFGVAQDRAQAASMFRKGCESGDARGCTNLGVCLAEGSGVSKDKLQAASSFQKGCDRGDAKGCTNLGVLYESGFGVDQDKAQGVRFFRKGCDGGNVTGCNNLGMAYESGSGVQQDRSQAVTYYRRACSGGNQVGCANLKRVSP